MVGLIINWSLFLPGVMLLLIPADALLSAHVQLRTLESFNNLDNTRRFRRWWWVPALWLDPWRGFGGALLVKHALTLTSTSWDHVPKLDYSLLVLAMLGGVVAQLYTRREEGVMLAPLGYVLGVAAALMPWPVALVAGIASLTGLFAFRHFTSYFLGGTVGVAFLGFVLGADVLWIIPAITVYFLPVLASLVTGKALELPTRDSSGSTGKFT